MASDAAALGIPVVTNPAVPSRIRRLITVESGLNDGIATPVVMLAIAGVASAEGLAGAEGIGGALLELAVGRPSASPSGSAAAGCCAAPAAATGRPRTSPASRFSPSRCSSTPSPSACMATGSWRPSAEASRSARSPVGADQQQTYQQPASPPQAAGEDVVQQLKDLAELKNQGILTQEEFAAQKAKILGT